LTWAVEVAARTLCQEVRGESIEGQTAVAWVLKNRLADGRWGNSLASVCLWRGQFSGWYLPTDPNFAYACSLADDDPTLSHMQSILQTVMDNAEDPTSGAMWYYNPDGVVQTPSWVAGTTFCGQFGHQKFYKGVK
jgi:spore germination cell wall hydrolase CwlJ-like protein